MGKGGRVGGGRDRENFGGFKGGGGSDNSSKFPLDVKKLMIKMKGTETVNKKRKNSIFCLISA